MTDAKNEIAVYDGPKSGELIRPDEPVTARNAPAMSANTSRAWNSRHRPRSSISRG